MKKADLDLYRQRLLMLRSRLRGDVTALENVALRKGIQGAEHASMPIHMAELGSENFEQEFALSLMATEGDTLAKIELALQRIEDGDYGKCVECEGVIPKLRLNAIPYAEMCVKCAEKHEQQ
jgi:DnaK suppressor protein